MSDTITTIVVAVLGSNALIEFIKWIFERRDSPERKMLRALGSDRLYTLLCDWKHNDVRPASEWETIDNLYDGYKSLKGNGEITKLYDECKVLQSTD